MYLLLLLLIFPRCRAESVIKFECGEHGRFEYCIDGSPGCVVGCYCHPGYYFDTETKICEHNSKLTQTRRRQYKNDAPIYTETLATTTETYYLPTTSTSLDTKVEEVTQEGTGDLSDWLYNQFFKTIEHQVLNHTDIETLNTRRSGRGKKRRLKNKKRKSASKKNKNLRRKILRITEDDSLFGDDSSLGSSDEDSSSSGETSSDSYESREKSKKPRQNKSHNKFIYIKKKPKPPLPSFIFLPNGDTPFYPPIGLPAPPVLPMYPMIPVPPMFVTGNDKSTEETSSTTMTVMSTSGKVTEKSSESTTKTTDPPAETDTEAPAPALRHPIKLKGPMNQNPIRLSKTKPTKSKHEQRKKLKALTVNNLMNRLKLNENTADNPFAALNLPPSEDYFSNDIMMPNEFKLKSTERNVPKGEDVDFKYLTDLIHKMDSNGPKNSPMLHFSSNDSIGMQESYPVALPVVPLPQTRVNILNNTVKPAVNNNAKPHRRSFNGYPNHELDDTFYTDLGRQIAALIRQANTEDANQITIELEKNKDTDLNQAEFYDNRYAPRSYWERTVRSSYQNPYAIKLGYLMKNNEHLYDLENKVKLIASTPPSYNLQQLENIINNIEKSRQLMRQKVNTRKQVNNDNRNELTDKIKAYNEKIPNIMNTLQRFVENYKTKLNYEMTPNPNSYIYPVITSTPSLIPSTANPIPQKNTIGVFTYNNLQLIPRLSEIYLNRKVHRGTNGMQVYPAGAKSIYSAIKSTSKPFSQYYPYNTMVLKQKPKLTKSSTNENAFLLLDEFGAFPGRSRDKSNVHDNTRRYYFDT